MVGAVASGQVETAIDPVEVPLGRRPGNIARVFEQPAPLLVARTLGGEGERLPELVERDDPTSEGLVDGLPAQFGDEVVWGFTATILDTLFNELGWSLPWDPARTFAL